MPVRRRNTIIISFLIMIVLPFVLLTDLYPFMRFGMFAEPIKQEFQTETFFIKTEQANHHYSTYDPAKDGLDEGIFLYLARNHYYRNEQQLFLKKINPARHYKIISATLYRVTYTPGDHSHADTTAIATTAP